MKRVGALARGSRSPRHRAPGDSRSYGAGFSARGQKLGQVPLGGGFKGAFIGEMGGVKMGGQDMGVGRLVLNLFKERAPLDWKW